MKDKQELKDEQKFYLKTCKEYEEQRDKQDCKSQEWHKYDRLAQLCKAICGHIQGQTSVLLYT